MAYHGDDDADIFVEPEDVPGNWVHIANLPDSITHDEILNMCSFDSEVQVLHIRIRTKRGRAEEKKPFAFVCFPDPLDAECARLVLHEADYRGNKLYVRPMKSGESASTHTQPLYQLVPPNKSLILDRIINKAVRSLQRAGPRRPATSDSLLNLLARVCTVSAQLPPRGVVLMLRRRTTDWHAGEDEEEVQVQSPLKNAKQSQGKKQGGGHLAYDLSAADFSTAALEHLRAWMTAHPLDVNLFSAAPGATAHRLKCACVFTLHIPQLDLLRELQKREFISLVDGRLRYLERIDTYSVSAVKKPLSFDVVKLQE